MEPEEVEEDEFGFSRNYFLAKEIGTSAKNQAIRSLILKLLMNRLISLVPFNNKSLGLNGLRIV